MYYPHRMKRHLQKNRVNQPLDAMQKALLAQLTDISNLDYYRLRSRIHSLSNIKKLSSNKPLHTK
ncbi:hypothetical protein HD_1070 [[Haemophilus] ducreyi 35000HP]|uniref:Uncharacterized protein n=1 Tax=Haemophilus ducreyi (strain 35000HP / ATCC 700724) TaxID=233412 RepID=Q7VMB9_HAEDU|nr:hypothetical protein HD_1070 [[Haemophilus] ducreyi 35000HP]